MQTVLLIAMREILKNKSRVRLGILIMLWGFLAGGTSFFVFNKYIPIKIAALVLLAVDLIAIGLAILVGLMFFVRSAVKLLKKIVTEYKYTEGAERRRNNKLSKKRKDSRIRVGFYVDVGQFFSTFADLYDSLIHDDRFEVVMLSAPEMEMYKNKIASNDAPKFFDEQKIPYINLYENGEFKKFLSLELDYCFYNRHYLLRQPKEVSFLAARKTCRICYIPYALCPQTGLTERTLCTFKEMRAFDYLFAENKYMADIYEKYKSEFPYVHTKILPAGSPKFAYAIKHTDSLATHDKKYVQSILYTPRWCFSEDTSSFFLLKDYFFRLAREHKDIEYVFRPHPLMKQNVIKTIGEDFWNEFIDCFSQNDNTVIDIDTDYMKSFSRASVLVSDVSTMMFEFAVTGKPIIYMYRKNVLNAFGIEAAKGYYVCTSPEEVNKVLADLRSGIDEKASLRKEIAEHLYHYGDADPSDRIKAILLKNYTD